MQYVIGLGISLTASAVVAAFTVLVGWEWVMEFLRAFGWALLYVGLPVAVLGVTFGWWWPKALALLRKLPVSERDRFRALYDTIKAGANAMHWSVSMGRVLGPTAQLDIARAKLLASLDALRIPYPEPLQYAFLIELAALASEGNLEDARTLLNRFDFHEKDLTVTDE